MLKSSSVVILAIYYVFLLVAGLFLNVLLLKVILSSRTNRRKISNLYLAVFLSVSVVACLVIATYHLVCLLVDLPDADPTFGHYANSCKAARFFVYTLSVLKVLALLILSFDRFWALSSPYHYSRYSRKSIVVYSFCFVVFQAVLTILPTTLIPGVITYQKVVGLACRVKWSAAPLPYVILVVTLDFILPALLLIFTNVVVFFLARNQRRKIEGLQRRKKDENKCNGLGLAKTLVRTVELMEVERERDVPHSVNSVCSSQRTSLSLASQSYLSSLPLDSKMVEMNEVSRSDSEKRSEKPDVKPDVNHADDLQENGTSDVLEHEVETIIRLELQEENENTSEEIIPVNSYRPSGISKQCHSQSDFSAVSNARSTGDQDEFSNLTREKQLKILSLPNSQVSGGDQDLDSSKWNIVFSTLLLVMLFLLTWLPFIISHLIETLSASHVLSNQTVRITTALNNADVVINPLIILFSRGNFRKGFVSQCRSFLLVCRRTRPT